MKKTLACLLALVMMTSTFSFASAEEAAFTVRETPVIRGGEQDGSLNLRFYSDAPSVAYLGMKAYVSFIMGVDLAVTAGEDGTWEVANPNGSSILVNPAAGTISAPDWASFQAPPVPYNTAVGIKDSACAWSYYSEIVYEDAPNAVVFDFAKYGIRIYADGEDVYLPLALLSTLFVDCALNYVVYNGETVFRPSLEIESLTGLPAGYYESERMRALITGEAERAEDEIRESYGELCFILDNFFGHPGVAELDAPIREKGLDAALRDMPDGEGEIILEKLMSPRMTDYLVGLGKLFFRSLDDGHTAFIGILDLIGGKTPYTGAYWQIMLGISAEMTSSSSVYRELLLQDPIRNARAAAWGNEVYQEFGSTAILRIDDFNPDTAGWEAYYAGTGDVPADAYGITWSGLKRASENPEIRNILFDLTANGGGSGDVLMAMMDLATGADVFRGYNYLTGQREHTVIHTDKNLDGVIDDKDREVQYDFNYGVLTTRMSFSCGNLFPFMMQENGAVLLGEPTGGGSCCVQTAALSGGAVFMMSGYNWTLRTENFESVEDGCRTDLPIERIESTVKLDINPRLTGGDYTPYFDGEMLDRMMNEWFAGAEEIPAA